MTIKVKTVKGFWLWLMKKRKVVGWASAWNTIYVVPGYETKKWLIAHEMEHMNQMERDGKICMIVKYFWYTLSGWIKYGNYREAYFKNPYEVEAYKVSDLIRYGKDKDRSSYYG